MAERLSDIELRLDSIGQLSSVVSAIRGIAAARLREADERLAGIRSYADTIAKAIGQALVLFPPHADSGRDEASCSKHLVIALCSEQGFVGGFNGHVLGTAESLAAEHGCSELFVIGDRGLMNAVERDMETDWSAPMAAHAEEVMTLANRLAEKLYERVQKGSVDRVALVHAVPGQNEVQTVTRRLIPFDFARFPPAAPSMPPLLNLPPEPLLASLAEEYVFAEICEAVMLSYAAESEARMYAMLAAHNNVDRRLGELTALARRMRQEEITAEVIELAAGAYASPSV